MTKVRNFLRDTSGATAVEYGLLAGIISLTIAVGLSLLGPRLSAKFSYLATSLS
ncbi:Flp/Fap pilin component [Beijerinckiaceae bacterium RH AL1]|jgi:pilus assembly protein Flp/PilA|nr:Flp family type IVb pilin [Beijerinckiaceae bacterium]VVB42075.1 Flp/Fap pilin component [Beijerinckiaceae bacterium RH AL8]VVB42076.1 Flp/Fap pilin component [Beijerinckiaceae bacterium RH CH11]VVC53125.1 Flp/Fap pilin component [Beijerinckiaceae bacterium RH AL1]